MISANLLSTPSFNPALFLQSIPENSLPDLERELLSIQQSFNEPAENAAQYAFDALLSAQTAVSLTETAVNHVEKHGNEAAHLVEEYQERLTELEEKEAAVEEKLEEKLVEKQKILNSIRVQKAMRKGDFFDPELIKADTDEKTRAEINGRKAAYVSKLLEENENLLAVQPSFQILATYFEAELIEYIQRQFTEQLISKLIRRLELNEEQEVATIVETLLNSCANLKQNSFKYEVSSDVLAHSVVLYSCKYLRKSFSAYFSVVCYRNNLFLHVSMMRLAKVLGIDKISIEHKIAEECELSESSCAFLRFLADEVSDSFKTSESMQPEVIEQFFSALLGYTGCVFDSSGSGACGGVFNSFVAVDVVVQAAELVQALCACPFELIDNGQLHVEKSEKRHFIYLEKGSKEPIRRCCFKTDPERQLRQFLELILDIYIREKRFQVSQPDFEALRGEEFEGEQYEAYLLYREAVLTVMEQSIQRLSQKTREYARLPFDAAAALEDAAESLRKTESDQE